MPLNTKRPAVIGPLVILTATCVFDAVVTYRWMMLEFPSSKFVLLMVFGMCVVGALAGFFVAALANIAFRSFGPAKLRLPITGLVWLAVCAILTKWLLAAGADQQRTLIVAGIASVSGLLVGTLNAEMIVGHWYLQKNAALRRAGVPDGTGRAGD
jgi:hypothetical protein